MNTLAQELPDDFILVPNVQVRKVPEIDLVVIRNDIIIAIEVKGWYGIIRGEPFAGMIQAGSKSLPNPILQVQKQTYTLVHFLKNKNQSRFIFDDPRVANTIYVKSMVIFANPEADIQLPSTDRVIVTPLAGAIDILRDPNLKRYPCQLEPIERERIAHLLLGKPLPLPGIERKDQRVEPCEPSSPPVYATHSAQTTPRFAPPPEDNSFETVPATTPTDNGNNRHAPYRSIGTLFNGVLGILDDIEQLADRRKYLSHSNRHVKLSKLARELETKLEDSLYHLLYETLACNFFAIHLSTNDFAHITMFQDVGEKELSRHIAGVINARDYQTKGAVQVKFVADDTIIDGDCKIVAKIDETAQLKQLEKESSTEVIPAPLDGPYIEHLHSGKTFSLNKSNICLGRSTHNDISIGELDTKIVVSRKHAQFRFEEDGWVLYDGVGGKPSSYGTYVDGEKLMPGCGCLLRDGQHIVFGPTQRANPSEPLAGSLLFVFHENKHELTERSSL